VRAGYVLTSLGQWIGNSSFHDLTLSQQLKVIKSSWMISRINLEEKFNVFETHAGSGMLDFCADLVQLIA
jgi:hypothetical protein